MGNVDPETGIWSMTIAKKRHKLDIALAETIFKCYDLPDKAADVGCGSGLYCRYFKMKGWNIIGFEGTPYVRELGIYDNILEVDLTVKINIGDRGFDFVLCLEVGEHSPKKYEEMFIDNVCGCTTKHLVLSWAIPGQYSASGHVNCQPNDYIIGQFEQRGLIYKQAMSNVLRKHAYFNWFKNTLMCFVKQEN